MPPKAQPFSGASAPIQDDAVREIVNCTHQHAEVLASPGSGKTHTLILRLQHLLDQGTLPQQILVLSFSKEAVRELCRRMDLACTNNVPKNAASALASIRVSTCHAFAYSLLRKPPAIISDTMQRKLLTRSIKMVRRQMRRRELWGDISTAQRQRRRELLDSCVEPSNIRRLLALLDYRRAASATLRQTLALPAFASFAHAGSMPVIKAISIQYQQVKAENSNMDFSDVLHAGVQRLRRGKLAIPYTHVLVDEFQDCSAAQTQLLAAVASTCHASVMVFGDPLQALYGFSGAQYQGLSAQLKDVQTLHLPMSHRLTRETAALASAIANHDKATAIQTCRTGPKSVLVTNTSQTAQAKQVVADIRQLLDGGASPGDIAVLARTKGMLNAVEAELLLTNIDANRIGSNRAHRHVMNVLRMVGWLCRWKVRQQPIDADRLIQLGTKEHEVDADRAVKEARALMTANVPATLEGRYILCSQSYLRLLGGLRQHSDVQADVNRWQPYSRQFSNRGAMRMAIQRMAGTGITTATVHAAKGREWRNVLVIGATDGILPIYHAKDDAALAEERNSLYVAVSRAKDSLRLYHAPTHNARTRQHFEKLSRFLNTKRVAKRVQHLAGE